MSLLAPGGGFVDGAVSTFRKPLPKPVSETAAWLGILLTAIAVGVLVFVALAPRVLGWHFVVVAGGSMEPTIGFGSLAVMEDVKGTPSAGDIVMFSDPTHAGRVITHRVVAVSEDGSRLTTRGDANPAADKAAVPVTAVRARYLFSVPRVGGFVNWTHSRRGYLTLILVPGLLIIAWEVGSIGRTMVEGLRSAPATQPIPEPPAPLPAEATAVPRGAGDRDPGGSAATPRGRRPPRPPPPRRASPG